MQNRNTCLGWLGVFVVACTIAITSAPAHGQFLIACCMPNGTCQEGHTPQTCASANGVHSGASCLFADCANAGCMGHCGGQSPWGCWCDQQCHNLGDCCQGICKHCTAPQVPACSCQNTCVGNAPHDCGCDPACISQGNCCLDFCQQCGGAYPDSCITCTGNTCASAVPTGDGIAPNSNNGLAGCTASGTSASCAPSGKDRWFLYTASCTGEARANVCSEFTNGNVAISIFSACPNQGGVEIACSNTNPFCTGGDANPNANAEVIWNTTAGATYRVRVSVTPNVAGHAFLNGLFFECIGHDGACCLEDGTCMEIPDFECANLGGEWRGPLTTCGACEVGCGHPEAGDCLAINGSPFCDDADCCSAVCEQDSYCCSAQWDELCLIQAEVLCTGAPAGECGSALSGGCFKIGDTPGCKHEGCCENVCNEIPACCDAVWDQPCVDLALDLCNQPGFGNSGGQTGTFSPAGAHGLFTYEVKYFNGSLLEGDLCCGLTELPQEVTANFVLDIYDGIGTTPGFKASIENVVAFSLQFGNNHWTDLLLFDMTLDAVAPNMATELFWMGTRLFDGDSTEIPLNFPLTFKGTDASGKPFEILYTDSICELVPTSCDEIGCCEGHCGGMSPLGCACDAGCVKRGDCCADACATCALASCPDTCPADLTGSGSVGVFDLLELLGQWGPCPTPPTSCPADLTSDNIVNVFDLLELLGQWGPCP